MAIDASSSNPLRWSVLGTVLPRLITPLSMLVLAAMLTPADFGVAAAATVVLSMASIVIGSGLGPAVIQRASLNDEVLATAFLSNSLLGVLGALVVCGIAPLMAPVIGVPEATWPIRLAAASLFFSAIATVPNAVMQREFHFRGLFTLVAVSQVVAAGVSIVLAIFRMGPWALIGGQVAGSASFAVLVLPRLSRVKRWAFSTSEARSLLSFGAWISLSSLMGWLYVYGDNALAGAFLGAKGLGAYSLAFSLASVVPATLTASVAAVAFPAFCQTAASDREALGEVVMDLQARLATALFPIAIATSLVAPEVLEALLGPKWGEIGPILRSLAILPGLGYFWSINAEGFKAVGKPGAWAAASAIALPILIVCLVVGSRFGSAGFAVGRSVGAGGLVLAVLVVTRRVLGTPYTDQLRKLVVPVLAGVAMTATVLSGRFLISSAHGAGYLAGLLLAATVGTLAYVVLVQLCAPTLAKGTLGLLLAVIGRQGAEWSLAAAPALSAGVQPTGASGPTV